MKHISPEELKQRIGDGQLFLLDVREETEHQEFNIGGKLIPLGELMLHSNEIPLDQPVVVYCKKGIRSQIAIQKLEEKLGLSNLINLKGGIDAWKRIFDL
ncbi:MAG: rhodanese-like domain-containing protein [Chitinophagaceae bacterium]|nr:rhodanese-like domain-containing protein [Chitinophagaceae bacterium]